ncbi:hypothetical protein [Rhodanobacter spathiphylli]|uniref:hypothetical protein n=1 Tax=Rhodanobacter spathiphylli TaxID=347483 RepID=UPI0012F87F16|nr:hypothetical protein [Rhodanobacter spathiphylli]
MQFVRKGDLLSVARITGSHDNLLQLRLSTNVVASPVVECLPARRSLNREALDLSKVLAAVIEGLAAVNQELGTSYSATHIRYVPNDSPPETVYGFLAMSLVRHLASGGKFVEA